MITPQRASDIPEEFADLIERREALKDYKLGQLQEFVAKQVEITLRYKHLPHNQD